MKDPTLALGMQNQLRNNTLECQYSFQCNGHKVFLSSLTVSSSYVGTKHFPSHHHVLFLILVLDISVLLWQSCASLNSWYNPAYPLCEPCRVVRMCCRAPPKFLLSFQLHLSVHFWSFCSPSSRKKHLFLLPFCYLHFYS